MKIDTVLNRIRLFRARSGLNTSQWARLVGRPDTTFRNMMSDEWNPTVSTIRECETVIPPEFMDNANDDDVADDAGGSSAAPADRGDDQHKAA